LKAPVLGLNLALLLAACQPAPPPAAGEAPRTDTMAPSDMADLGGSAVPDAWIGAWTGPEGTSLKLSKANAGYRLVITNLDGPRDFHGLGVDGSIQFERDGVTESLRASDGKATGMKWLAEKRDCLTVKPGEGYCRD
jgi:hypothetical protein